MQIGNYQSWIPKSQVKKITEELFSFTSWLVNKNNWLDYRNKDKQLVDIFKDLMRE